VSLKTKALQGVFWVIAVNIVVRGFNFLVALLLAKILTPEEFGFFGIAEIVINVTQVFKDMGLTKALISRTEQIQEAACTIFFMNVGGGLGITLIIMALAKPIAIFFGEPNVSIVIQFMATTIFVTSFGLVPMALVEKELAFNKKLLPESLPIVIYAITAMILAMFQFGVWSIIVGRITQTLVAVILTWYVSGWRLKFYFDYQIAKETLKYGRNVVLASLLTITFSYIDNAFVAKFLGIKALGFYVFAFTLANLPTQSITPIINQVAFPAYVKLRFDIAQLAEAYFNAMRLTALITFPITVGLAVLADKFVQVVYGEKWLASVALIQILSFYGLARSIGALCGNIFYTLHRHYIIPRLMLLYLAIITICLWPTSYWLGLLGVAFTMTTVMIAGTTIWLLMVNYYLGSPLSQLIKNLQFQTIASGLMALGLLYSKPWVSNSFMGLIGLILEGIGIYMIAILLLTKGKVYQEVINLSLMLRGRSL